ncbi:hypothetical protein BN1180_04019 [Peribacillus simplex]|uniref:Uncharacterized protein n=1 Tax=Peribacillus simplex TaxID=1478 RepID=A0AAN2TU39_9BACI|nr:hypothetical protein BN1180_04019 [Peribacillus simplex]
MILKLDLLASFRFMHFYIIKLGVGDSCKKYNYTAFHGPNNILSHIINKIECIHTPRFERLYVQFRIKHPVFKGEFLFDISI